MRASHRLGIGVSAVFLMFGVPTSVDADSASPSVPSASVDAGPSVVSTPDEGNAAAPGESEGSRLRPVLGFVLIATVFVVGLRAVKRQREEGRRSKLPPIG